jgi:hypothetical protein
MTQMKRAEGRGQRAEGRGQRAEGKPRSHGISCHEYPITNFDLLNFEF